jgi:hypothetical protein
MLFDTDSEVAESSYAVDAMHCHINRSPKVVLIGRGSYFQKDPKACEQGVKAV